MKIKALKLLTNKLEEEKLFYNKTLGFSLLENEPNQFSIQVGHTKLTFQKSEIHHLYHYCFLIPSNQLQAGIEWLSQRTKLIKIEEERVIQNFESWNADSIYFYDASGNLAEFIVRYGLQNNSSNDFEISNILSVNEIGMPTQNIQALNLQLEKELKSYFWKGDQKRFGTNGTEEGLFLLPNYQVKNIWFPTNVEIKPSPFEATISIEEKDFSIKFENEILSIHEN